MTNEKTLSKEELRIKNIPEHEQKLREAALMTSSIIGLVAAKVAPGVTLNELEMEGARLFHQFGATPANYKYKPDWASRPYPAVMCLSVNNTIAHGIPNDYTLQEGDIINIDTGLKFNGVSGDCAMTVPVGKISNKHERLLRFANRACYTGIQQIRDGVTVIEIAKAIDLYAKQMGYVTNQVFSGHDIAEEMHGTGLVIPFFYDSDPRYLKHFSGKTLHTGQVVCIEPILTFKDRQGKLLQDGWGLVTKDGKYSAMFEHMVLVKEDGYEILTDHFSKA